MASGTYNSAAAEGHFLISNQATWAAAHDASSATSNSANVIVESREGGSGSDYNIKRASFPIDTTLLPQDSIISAAVFSAYRDDDVAVFANGSTTSLDLVTTTVASSSSRSNDDFNNFNSSSYANVALAATSDDTYADFTLSDTSIITKGGITYLGLREHNDVIDNDIGTNKNNNIGFQGRGDANPPKLVVTYTVTGTGFIALFT